MRVALIGCGFFAQNQLEAWRDIDGVDIVALCDTDPAKLAATGKAFDIARQYTDAAQPKLQRSMSFPSKVRSGLAHFVSPSLRGLWGTLVGQTL